MIAIIRIRGSAKARKKTEDTLRMLHLETVNNCVVIPENASFQGMIQEAKDFITWGPADKAVFKKMLLKWGRTVDNKKTDEKFFSKTTADDFVNSLFENKTTLQDSGIKPVFRLHPPRGGYEGIKNPVSLGGALGSRGEKINNLLEKMI